MNAAYSTSDAGGTGELPSSSSYFSALARYLQSQVGTDDRESLRTIGVISCTAGEGVTTVATNLAIAAAGDHFGPVLLVDANLQQPDIATLFGVDSHLGLANVLNRDRAAMEVLKSSPVENLSLMLAGEYDSEHSALVDAQVAQDLFEVLADVFKLTIVDLPPLSQSSISGVLVAQLEGILVVVEEGCVEEPAAREIRQQLLEVGAHLLGVVYNKATRVASTIPGSSPSDGFRRDFASNS